MDTRKDLNMETMQENAITAAYEDVLKFIDNEAEKTSRETAEKAKEKQEGPKQTIVRLLVSSTELSGMVKAAAFAYGKTEEKVRDDLSAIAAKKFFMDMLAEFDGQ